MKTDFLKHFKNIVAIVMTAMIIGVLVPAVPARAASGYASVGSASGEAGAEVTISLSISADTEIGGASIVLSYDSSSIEFVSGSDMSGGAGTISAVYSDTFSGTLNKSFTVKILKTGTSYISVLSSSYMVSMDGDKVQVSGGSGSVTGNAPITYSTDNNLSSLSISPGTLSPAFSSSVTTYTTSVDADCSQLVVSAVASDANASVSVSGTRLDPGSNTTTVTVTAQSGATKTYTIYTTRAESETSTTKAEEELQTETAATQQPVKIDGKSYKIASTLTDHPLPAGYDLVEYSYEGTTIQAGRGVNTKLTLIYLESADEKGVSGFYIYDSVAKTFTLFTEVTQPEISYVLLPITDSMEKPEGLTLTEYNMNGVTAKVMMSGDRSYCVFYGISSTGVTGWFKYDCTDKTIQIYSPASNNAVLSTNSTNNQTTNSSYKVWKLLAFIAFGALLAAVIAAIVLATKLSKTKKAFMAVAGGYSEMDNEDDNLERLAYDEEDDILEEEDDSTFEEKDDSTFEEEDDFTFEEKDDSTFEEEGDSTFEELELFDIEEKK